MGYGMPSNKVRRLAGDIARARIWLERNETEKAKECLEGAASIIPNHLYPNHDDIIRDIDREPDELVDIADMNDVRFGGTLDETGE